MFDLEAWLNRIAYDGSRTADLATLHAVIAAHTATVPFENIGVLLGHAPKLAPDALHDKVIVGRRGGYCFELNAVLRDGLRALGFDVAERIARVVRGQDAAAPTPATHMMLQVDLPEGRFLADVGFGNQTPTAPLQWQLNTEQQTPHEPMRLTAVGDDVLLQAQIGENWENIYRILPHPPLQADYEVGNWFGATHPNSPFVGNMIVARAGHDGTRTTFFNGRLTIRRPGNRIERRIIDDTAEIGPILRDTLGLPITNDEVAAAIEILKSKGTLGATHAAFA